MRKVDGMKLTFLQQQTIKCALEDHIFSLMENRGILPLSLVTSSKKRGRLQILIDGKYRKEKRRHLECACRLLLRKFKDI